MRKITATLGGAEITLGATFEASLELADKVADPLEIWRAAGIEASFTAQGLAYEPRDRVRFTVRSVPIILHIGMKAAGDTRTLAQVQSLVFDAGFPEAQAVALDYIAAIVTPRSQQLAGKTQEGDAPGE